MGPILVIQTAFLGDVVLTTPLLTALARGGTPVDVVTTPGAAPLLETHPEVRRVWRYDKHGADRGWLRFRHLAGRLRAEGYARAVVPHRSVRSAALARMAGIPDRVGFAGGMAGWLHTRRVPRSVGGHEVERLFALAEVEGPTPAVSLGLLPADMAAADAWLAAHGVADPFIAVAPGSIWGTKRWPTYAELLAALEGPVVVIGGPEDIPLARAVADAAPGRGVSAAGELPLRASAALIARARVLVTNDSAPLHLATAVGTRIVALFGPTVPAFGFGPRRATDMVLEVPGLACRPCSAHGPMTCPLGHHRCMTALEVPEVVTAVRRAVGQTDRHSDG